MIVRIINVSVTNITLVPTTRYYFKCCNGEIPFAENAEACLNHICVTTMTNGISACPNRWANLPL